MMEREKGRSRKRVGRPLGLMNFLQREGKRCCAFVLCFTMIVGNTASLAVAAVKQESDVLFQLDRESLYAALQEAVLRNQVANEDFQFSGEAADDYDMLLGEMSNDMGELYELKREQTEDSDENEELSLRIFARLDGEIPLMDEEMTEEYQITGSEQFIFLLTNRTDKKQTAEIQVDDKRTEVITVLPGSSVDVREEETEKAEETETKKAGGGSAGGNKSEGNKTEVNVTEEDTTSQETESASVQETEETTETEQESVSEEETAKEEPSSEEGTDEEEIVGSEEESAEEESTQEETTEAEETTEEETAKEETVSEKEETDTEEETNIEDETDTEEEEENQEEETDSADQASEAEESEEKNGGAAEAAPEENAGADQGSDEEKGAEANDSAEDIQADVEEDGENSVEEYSLGISRNEVSRVAFSLTTSKATSSDADKDEDKSTPSDAEVETLEGVMYDTVYMNDEVVAAFVTTASDLGLDEDFWAEEPEEELPEVLPPQVIVPEKKTDGPKVFRQELDNVIVEVTAEEGVLPEDAELRVEELEEDGDQYQAAKEALDDAGTEYSGMMALDISFWVGDEEIEPDGRVQVSMKLRQEVLPEEADPESLAVQHLAEDKSEVHVEVVADCGDEAEGTIKVHDAEHVAAEFEVESFSTFTITWNDHFGKTENGVDTVAEILFRFVDEEGTGIDDVPVEGHAVSVDNVISIADYRDAVEFYEFQKAELVMVPGEVIDEEALKGWMDGNGWGRDEALAKLEELGISIYKKGKVPYSGDTDIKTIKTEGTVKGNEIENGKVILTDVNGTEIEYTKDGGEPIQFEINLIYKKTEVQIQDSIKTDGCLRADISSELPANSNLEYRWYRSSEKESEENWERVYDFISEDGRSINVARDNGSRYFYKVEVVSKNGEVEYPVGSATYQVKYYKELQNGSFESPEINQGFGAFYHSGMEGVYWKTTAPGGLIEYVKKGSTAHMANNLNVAGEEQCAELNAHTPGALYQDILTVPGSELFWSLYHRARKGSNGDTMYVVIMPTDKAEEETFSLEEAKTLCKNKPEGTAVYIPGVANAMIWKFTDGADSWSQKNDNYVVGEDQYLTRFFFIAGDTGQSPTEGNLLDEIKFSSSRPVIDPGKANIEIKKVVEGLSAIDIPEYSLDFEISGGAEEQKVTLTMSSFARDEERSTVEKTVYSQTREVVLGVGDYTITENIKNLDGYTCSSSAREIKFNVAPDDTGKLVLKDEDMKPLESIVFVNTYTPDNVETKTLKVKKEVTGNGGNRNEEFTFTYEILQNGTPVSEDVYQSIELIDRQTNQTVEKKDGHQFTLKDGQEIEIGNIPKDCTVKVTEEGAEGYSTSVKRTQGTGVMKVGNSELEGNKALPGKSFELTITDDTEVVFINEKTIATPTGVHTNRFPHLLMMAVAALSMAGMAFTSACAKVHKKDED